MIQPSEHNKQTVESYFGFQQPPFGVTPDPRFFYMNTAYRDALAEVAHGITAKKGLMLLTGEVGTGKTILLRKLMRDLDTVKFIFVSFSHVISDRFLDVVSSNLGLEKKKTKVDMSQELTKYLLQRATDGQVVALLVDEAQNASDRGFEALCALSNLETDDEKLLQIVLVGQPELIIKLDKPSLRQVKQRVAIQHTVTGLQTKSEIDHYIRHRLNVVGYNGPQIFTQEALDAIWDYSGGTPRLVNILCDNSLALACEAGNRNISGDVAIKAAEKFNLKRIVQLPTFADEKQQSAEWLMSGWQPKGTELPSAMATVWTDLQFRRIRLSRHLLAHNSYLFLGNCQLTQQRKLFDYQPPVSRQVPADHRIHRHDTGNSQR